MTYGEAGIAREAVGSGLRINGLQKVSHSKNSALPFMDQFHQLCNNDTFLFLALGCLLSTLL